MQRAANSRKRLSEKPATLAYFGVAAAIAFIGALTFGVIEGPSGARLTAASGHGDGIRSVMTESREEVVVVR